jgi:hypothetical protein
MVNGTLDAGKDRAERASPSTARCWETWWEKLMTAEERRCAVTFLRASLRASMVRNCRLVGIGRSRYA